MRYLSKMRIWLSIWKSKTISWWEKSVRKTSYCGRNRKHWWIDTLTKTTISCKNSRRRWFKESSTTPAKSANWSKTMKISTKCSPRRRRSTHNYTKKRTPGRYMQLEMITQTASPSKSTKRRSPSYSAIRSSSLRNKWTWSCRIWDRPICLQNYRRKTKN